MTEQQLDVPAQGASTNAELEFLEGWCEQQRSLLGAVDGYDYRSGEEFGIRRVEIEIAKRRAKLAAHSPAGCGTPGCVDPDCNYANEPAPAVSKLTGVDLLRAFADAFRSGAQGADMDCDSAQAMAEAIDHTVSLVEGLKEQIDHLGTAIYNELDNIEVDDDGTCAWTAVANAQEHIKAIVSRALSSTVSQPSTEQHATGRTKAGNDIGGI